MGGFFKSVGKGLGILPSSGQGAASAALDLFNEIKEPELKKLALTKYSMTADPRDFLTALQDSELKNLQTDPVLKEAQMNALGKLQEIGNQGGLTAQDKQLIGKVTQQQKVTEQGQRQAISQQAAQRGVGGSGLEAAQNIAAQQNAANQAAQQGTDVASLALQRQQQAIQQAGLLGGQIRGQEFDEGARKAQAQDAINQFNVGAKNLAGLESQRQRQSIAQGNVDLANQEQMYNTNTLAQQRFENSRQLAGDKANALNRVGIAGDARSRAAIDFGGQAASGALAAFGLSDERAKENIAPATKDVEQFLDTISASKYNYKDEKHGKGTFAGPMAQEVEKTKLGKSAIVETPDGKMLDMRRMATLALAGTKVLHEKIKKLEKK